MECKNKSIVVSVSMLTAVLCSCSVSHVMLVQSVGENLSALSQIHESEYRCESPFGGDNGKDLFFTIQDKNGFSNICRKDNPLNKSMIQLTGGRNYNYAPSYCATSGMVAFYGRTERSFSYDIYMVDGKQGGALSQITDTPDYDERFPCISRDGKMIVYERKLSTANDRETEIWLKNLQTNETQLIGLGRTPSFAPDGKSIACVRYASDGYNTYLCVINIDGSAVRQLTDASIGNVVWQPRFSPDGNNIVFQCFKPQKKDYDLYVIDRNGSTPIKQLTINSSYDGDAYWANDGNIYFTSDRGGKNGHYQIWRFQYGAYNFSSTNGIGSNVNTSYNSSANANTSYGNGTNVTYHTVSDGETITQIAKMYGVTVRDIVRWNNLTTMTITSGMRLKVSAQ